MAVNRKRKASEKLGATLIKIEEWRATRTKLGPMPRELWSEAVARARAEGVWFVSQVLRLNYDRLKTLVSKETGGRPARPRTALTPIRDSTPTFVEVRTADARADPQAEVVLELTDASGATLALRAPMGVDLAGVIGAFRERARAR